MVSSNVGYLGIKFHVSQDFPNDFRMGLGPIEARFELPAVDDVSDEIQVIACMTLQKRKQTVGLATLRA